MKTVLITGCSSGFGLSMAQGFFQDNWKVLAAVRSFGNCGDFIKEKIKNQHPNFSVIKLDLSVAHDIAAVPSLLQQETGNKLDCLVNNAGFGLVGPLEKLTDAQIRYQMEVNFFGLVSLTQACLPALRHAKGKIINISSVLGFVGSPLYGLYCASKFAVQGFSQSLYYELAPFGVQVALVEPGMHRSKFSSNIIAGHREFAGSELYLQQIENLQNFQGRLKNKQINPAEKIANCVIALANKKNMPVRVQVGSDSKFLYYLYKFLPDDWAHAILKRFYNKLLLRKKPVAAAILKANQ